MEDKTKTGDSKHALLSASGSHRWLECTPSATAEARYPDKGSDFAREGTLAHAMGSLRIKGAMGMDAAEELREIEELKGEYHSGEMEEYADGYAAFVLDKFRQAQDHAVRCGHLPPELRVEQRLDYSEWVPGGFGTGDAVIVADGELEVIDLKYGKGVEVSAERNPQMMLYALGAVSLYDYAYDIDRVRVTVYQPRIGNVSSWSLGVGELRRWGDEEVRPRALLASRGGGVRHSGAWCRFCKAKGDCATLAAESLDLWQLNSRGGDLTAEDYSRILPRLETVKDWVKAVEERSLALALGGGRIEGWKLVEGRSVRKIADAGEAVRRLREHGATEEEIWREPELRTLTELEKRFGKKQFGEWMGCVLVKPAGKPTLVPASDRRKPLEPGDEFRELEIKES